MNHPIYFLNWLKKVAKSKEFSSLQALSKSAKNKKRKKAFML
jgi:hypothetical protein